MLKNGFKAIKIKTLPINKTPVFLIIKKQKYLCKPLADCLKQSLEFLKLKEFNRNIESRIQSMKVL